MKFYSFIYFSLFFCLTAQADLKHEYIQKLLNKRELVERSQPADTSIQVTAGQFIQRLDHNNPKDDRTFKQNFFYNSAFATDAYAPVLLFICGESVCEESDLKRKTMVEFAKALGAHLISLEHRYYGYSVPFSTLTAENLQYLSTEYALKDLAALQAYAQQNLEMKGPWIAIGGSYSGSLAAYYRLYYPNNVVGALASSAPVMAKANFEEYDRHVSQVAGPVCSEKMRSVVREVERQLESPDTKVEIKTLFGGQEIRNDVDFLYTVADMAAFAVQYGFSQQFCSALEAKDPVLGYATVGKQVLARFGFTPLMISFQAAENLDPKANFDFAIRQWMYQSCTEYGYYQVAHHDEAISVRSKQISLPYHHAVCHRLFGLEAPVNDRKTNQTYYEPLLIPEIHNIFLTNGSTDPWTNLSITKENGNDVNPNLKLYTLVGGAHCTDLGNSSTPAAVEARQIFLSLAKGWISLKR